MVNGLLSVYDYVVFAIVIDIYIYITRRLLHKESSFGYRMVVALYGNVYRFGQRHLLARVVLNGDTNGNGSLHVIDKYIVETERDFVVGEFIQFTLERHANNRINRTVGKHIEGIGHITAVIEHYPVCVEVDTADCRVCRHISAVVSCIAVGSIAVIGSIAGSVSLYLLLQELAQIGGDELVFGKRSFHLHNCLSMSAHPRKAST